MQFAKIYFIIYC